MKKRYIWIHRCAITMCDETRCKQTPIHMRHSSLLARKAYQTAILMGKRFIFN